MTQNPQLLQLPDHEAEIIQKIKFETDKKNLDNISRTKAYLDFYLEYPEMIWSFLASMVSRNGGYNMCDLEGDWFPKMLEAPLRHRLFLTYERANWLIFRDAFSQLLLYSYSTKKNAPMFHLLKFLDVSQFMEAEWSLFWERGNKKRLMTALIINEQNVIHKPVIKHPVYKKRVFNTFMFSFEDYLHFSTVLFPTCEGELFGASVNGFRSISKRINLGKRLADILFNPGLYPYFLEFALNTEHTASRHDYEKYFPVHKKRDTPFLRTTYPVISHHDQGQKDWYEERTFKREWIKLDVEHRHPTHLTKWHEQKQKQLHALIALKDLFNT
ncbi:DUF2515 domain-containing protein [Mesobacillus subterraneus]|uniref:DUF2515 domain-containing protein n=1 Tax=Mesobacillus subterraneus TaxID=285983 RepID=A0A3R9EZA4_9BACI|nr:DUF2515 domain-containing protein [Mesobacillus subterraneus]RSD26533.1 DUF2515 domain-containing protein [Mesobacillus subterraneus]